MWRYAPIAGFVLLAGLTAQAQTAPATQTAASGSNLPSQNPAVATTSTPVSPVPSKKVWTNDDVGTLRVNSPISTVGAAPARQQKQANKPVASPGTIKSYRDQILRLQGQLPDLDAKIAELQGVISGNTVNSTRHVGGTKIDDWHDELARLQQQRADTSAKISTLQDQARHNGVPENEIPE